jgi:hypothetical protein
MDVYTDLRKALSNPNHVLEEAPFTMEVVEAMQRVARKPSARWRGHSF